MPVRISNPTKPQTLSSAVVRIFVLTALLLLHLAALGCCDPRNGNECDCENVL
jgi:hypothetical protein